MAKNKPTRHPKTPDVPVLIDARSGPPLWRDLFVIPLLLLATGASLYIWLYAPPTIDIGFGITGALWVIAFLGLLARVQARHSISHLQAMIAHGEFLEKKLEPVITESQTGLKMRYVSAWLVAGLGIAASVALWYTDALQQQLGGLSTLIVGGAVSIMFGFAVAANVINRLKTRRLASDLRTALESERLALDTIGALDVMISACLPNGERARFNSCFLDFVGRTAAEMQGHGWLEIVHPDDRESVMEIVSRPLSAYMRPRRHDICVRHRDGEYVWIQETLSPLMNEKGELIEFIGTAIDITSHVQNEASLDKQIGALKLDLDKATTELADVKNDLSKTRTSRNRFEKSAEELRQEVKSLQDALNKSEASIERIKSEAAAKLSELKEDIKDRELAMEKVAESRASKFEDAAKSARQEAQQAAAENKKLARAFDKLQEEMGQVRNENSELREQVARHIKESREAKTTATDAHSNEASHRAKNDRLTKRCEELEAQLIEKERALTEAQALEAQLAAKDAELAAAKAQAKTQVQHAQASAAAQVERSQREVPALALATELRKQLNGMQRSTDELLAQALDGPVKDAAHNTAATVRAMSELVDQALNGGVKAPPAPSRTRRTSTAAGGSGAALTSFDLRRTASGVRDLLIDDAKARGVSIDVEIAPNLPALVHGDDIEIRTAFLSLTDAALRIVPDGMLIIRLSEDVSTGAHSTIRCELKHASARVKADAFDAALAIKSTDAAMPDPVQHPQAHQAAKAWKTIRHLQGQHGYMLPDEGGFSVWFTFILGRPAAAGSSRSLRDAISAVDQLSGGEAPPGARSTASTKTAASADSGPQMPRMPQEMLNCTLGEVVELGGDSMRIICSKAPKYKEFTLKFVDVEMTVELSVEVLWSKKITGRKHDVGLKFVGLSAAHQKQILKVAMQHRKVVTLLDEANARAS